MASSNFTKPQAKNSQPQKKRTLHFDPPEPVRIEYSEAEFKQILLKGHSLNLKEFINFIIKEFFTNMGLINKWGECNKLLSLTEDHPIKKRIENFFQAIKLHSTDPITKENYTNFKQEVQLQITMELFEKNPRSAELANMSAVHLMQPIPINDKSRSGPRTNTPHATVRKPKELNVVSSTAAVRATLREAPQVPLFVSITSPLNPREEKYLQVAVKTEDVSSTPPNTPSAVVTPPNTPSTPENSSQSTVSRKRSSALVSPSPSPSSDSSSSAESPSPLKKMRLLNLTGKSPSPSDDSSAPQKGTIVSPTCSAGVSKTLS